MELSRRLLLSLFLCCLVCSGCIRLSKEVMNELQTPSKPFPKPVHETTATTSTPFMVPPLTVGQNHPPVTVAVPVAHASSSTHSTAPVPVTTQNNSSVSVYYPPRTASSTASPWHTYRNAEYSFTFQYTGTVLMDDQQTYTRIQNYDDTPDRLSLRDGEYYLEIYIAEKGDGLPSVLSCAERFPGATQTQAGAATVYRMNLPQTQGANAAQFSLCAERSSGTVFITVTESDPAGSIANAILSSVKFTYP